MTTYIKVDIKGKKAIVKVGGYTGKGEAPAGPRDIQDANRIWLTQDQKRKLGLKYGQTVTMNFSYGIKRRGEVLKWSRGSAQIVFDKPFKLSLATAKKLYISPSKAKKLGR